MASGIGKGSAAQSVLCEHKMQEAPAPRIVFDMIKVQCQYGALPATKFPGSPMNDLAVRTRPAPYQSYWMPFTTNLAFKKNPRLIASAIGMYYRRMDGAEVLDGTAGLS